MYTRARRALSWVLAIALLITCGISGLVLPTLAGTADPNVVYSEDFQNGADGWTFAGEALTPTEDPADATNLMATMTGSGKDIMLKTPTITTDIAVGDQYLVRFKVKTPSGTQTRVAGAFYNKTDDGYQSFFYDVTNTDWMTYQMAFTAQVAATTVSFGLYLETSGVSLYVDDVQLIKVNENTNYVVGGDMEGDKTYWLNKYYSKGAVVEEDTIEAGNKVLHVPAGKSDLWLQMMGLNVADQLYEVSFRYRGGSIQHWWSADHSALYQNVGSTAASETWKQFRAYVQTKSTTYGNYFMIRTDTNGSKDVWLDDIVVRKVSAISLDETANVYVNGTTTLTPVLTPADATLTKFTWASDNEEVATVENGVVTGVSAGKANITATAGPFTATCAVTAEQPPAREDTFKLAKDELYLAPADGGYVVYAAVPPVTLDGKEYTETLTWTTNNSSVVAISDASTGLLKTVKDSTGTAVITATNAEGESHSCTVTVAWDGERISGGDFESVASATNRWTTNIIKSGAGTVITEEDGNHVLEIPAGVTGAKYYQSMTMKSSTKYLLSFDIKGNTGSTNVLYTSSGHTTVFGSSKASFSASGWQSITPKADAWTHYEFYIETKSGANLNYIFGLGNSSTTGPVYLDNVSFYQLGTAESISLSNNALSMEIGNTATLSVTAAPENATMNRVQWSSSNEAVATVDKDGKVKAVSGGTATITAKSGMLTAECAVTVAAEKVPATGLSLNKQAISLLPGGTETLTVSAVPSGAVLPADITWTTGNKDVATVENGKVTAVSGGTATITATAGTLSATCEVTVTNNILPNGDVEQGKVAPWTGMTVEQEADGNHVLKIPAGTAYNTAYYWKGMAALAWQENTYYLVSFDVKGDAVRFMTASATNVTTTTVDTLDHDLTSNSNGRWARYYSVVKIGEDYEINSDWTFHFKTYRSDKVASNVDTYIDNVSIVKIDTAAYDRLEEDFDGDVLNGLLYKGMVTELGVKLGGTIVADPDDKTNKVFMIPQAASATATYYKFDYPGAYLNLNGLFKLTVRYKGATYTPTQAGNGTYLKITNTEGDDGWTTFEEIVDLNSNASNDLRWAFGLYSTTNAPLYIDSIALEEIPTATSITLSNETLTLTEGEEDTLTVATTPADAYIGAITWASDTPSVATVENGKVTAVSEGTAKITATVDGLPAAECTVTVEKAMATDLLLNKQAVTLFPGETATLTVSVLPVGGWYDENIVWFSDNEDVATVENGMIKAVSTGMATIVATAGNLTATCTVTVPEDIVTGGDFEEGAIGTFAGVGSNSTYSWYIAEGEGYGGGNALAINYKGGDHWLKWPTFAPNTTYALTFMAKGPTINLQLYKYDGSVTNWATVTTTDYQSDWTQYRVEFTTGANGLSPSSASGSASYGFTLKRVATSEDTTVVTYVDNFSIIPTEQNDERILGGDFEVPGPQQWNLYHLSDTANGIKVVKESDGNKALFLPASDAKWNVNKYLPDVYLKANTDYVLTFKAKGDPCDMYLHSDSVTTATQGGKWLVTQASDDYVTYAYSFTTTATVKEDYVLDITRNTSIGTEKGTWLDDVSIRTANSDIVAEEQIILGGKGEVKPGTEMTFGVKLSNQGTNAIVDPFAIDFCLNGKVWSTKTFNGIIPVDGSVNVLADEIWTAVEGDYAVSVKVNEDLSILESNVHNNELSTELRVAADTLTAPQYATNAGFTTLTFSDDFNSIDTIDTTASGAAGYKWYVTRPYGASTLTTNDYAVENGILTLKAGNPLYNYGIATMDVKTGNGFKFNKGYMEIKFRIPKSAPNADGEKGIPAIWSLPDTKLLGKDNHWLEMDWMEYWGKDYIKYWRYPKGFYTVTMHDQELNADGTTKHWYRNNNSYSQNGLGDAEWHVMGWLWQEGNVTTYLDGTQVMSQSFSADSKGSPTISKVEGEAVTNGAFTVLNDQVMSVILGGSADNPMEVDYVHIWQNVEEETIDAVYADVTVDNGDIAVNEAGEFDDTVATGDTVKITLTPEDGYIMKPGSLKYVTKDGTTAKILNQSLTDFTFGGGDGHSFEFTKPEGLTKVTAEFVSATPTDFAVDTIGTSIRPAAGNGYDGIRFLTRMNMATTFDPEAETLSVTYGGKTYEVIEIGSLLTRYAENVTLDLDNYTWISRAYVKGGNLSLVDYTDSYIDFTVIMTKGKDVSQDVFNARKYTARGYLVLQDAAGNKVPVYCETMLTNCINDAAAVTP